MATLPTYQSSEQLRTPRSAGTGDFIRKIGRDISSAVSKRQEYDTQMELAEQKNQVDLAKINTNKAVALLDERYKADPMAFKEGEYEDSLNKIRDEQSATISSTEGASAYDLDTSFGFTKAGIGARAIRGDAVFKQGQQNTLDLLQEVSSQDIMSDDGTFSPAKMQMRLQQGEKVISEAQQAGFVKNPDKLRVDGIKQSALNDAVKFDKNGNPMFDTVLNSLSNLRDSSYPLDGEERQKLYTEIQSQKKMVMGQRADEATGAFVGIMAEKMRKNIRLEVDDAMQFENVIPSKELKGLLKIVAQSQKDVVTEARAGTRYDQSQESYWRGEGERFSELLDLPENAELKQQFEDGTLSADKIKDNKNIPEETKKQLVTISNEVARLQKFEKFDTDREVAVGRLNADLDKYNYDSLVTKLSTDPLLKTLESSKKEKILNDHERIIAEGQGFRSSKSWQTSYNQMLAFYNPENSMGFAGGIPDTTDQKVMDKAVRKNEREFAQAQKNFLARSEWAFRQYKKNPTGDEPNYYQIGEQEIRPYRVQQEDGAIKSFIKDVFTLPVTKYMAGKEAAIDEQEILAQQQSFESSPESQQFEAYMAEKEQIAQGAVSNAIGSSETQPAQAEFKVGEIQNVNGVDYKYLGNDSWQPLN